MTSTSPQPGDRPVRDAVAAEVAHRRRELSSADDRPASPRGRGNGTSRPFGHPGSAPTLERARVQPPAPNTETPHVGDLLPLHGRRFVDAAYRTLLGRPMDAAGEAYVQFLQAGGPKARVLRAILDSDEGRARGATLRGFGRLRWFDRLSGLPVVGYPIRWLWTLATLPKVASLAHHVQQDALRRLDEVAETHNRNAQDIEIGLGSRGDPAIDPELEQRVDALERSAADLAPRMAAFFAELDNAKPDFDVDAMYSAFEDRFRGASSRVADTQRQYVDVVRDAGAGTADRPILDLGCGRGEWLQLLADADLVAHGIDASPTMVARCREAGLDVAQGESLTTLRETPPATYGAITGFHIIEHMPASWQIRLLELAYRAVKPGGVVIFETPNPEHLPVGALRFYVDPTHVRPLPSALAEFLAEHIGFVDYEIRYLWPADEAVDQPHGWSPFQDYALIGRRPSNADQEAS